MIGTNPYFPAGQEDIDNIEEDPHYYPDDYREFSMMTDNSMLDHMTDYADEFGDQKLINLVQTWMEHKMGTKLLDDTGAKIRVLREVMDELGKLNKKERSLDYTIAITDIMIIIMQKMQSL